MPLHSNQVVVPQSQSHQFPILVLVDPAVQDYQSLINSVHSEAEVVVLDPTQDGVQQITDVLADRHNIEALHILSHGESGKLYLGSGQLSLETLSRYTDQIRAWSKSLAANAELLLYGCFVAAEQRGRSFIQQLGQLTGRSIAASTNLTGNAALGGDWNLEMQTGEIRSFPPFQPEVLAAYPSVLVPALANQVYAAGDDGSTELRVLDLATGASTVVGNLAFGTFAIGRQANTGRIYYIEIGPNGRVAYFDPATSSNTILGTTGVAVGFNKLGKAADGNLYAIDGTTTTLYRLDPTTGAAISLGAISGGSPAFTAGSGDLAFDPNDPNRFFVNVTQSGFYRLYSVNLTTLAATFVGDVTAGGTVLSPENSGALAFGQDGQLYLTSADSLYRVNPTNATATLVGPTGVQFSDFGSLPTPTPGVDVGISVTDGLTTVTPGGSITYTITVINNSPNLDVTGIAVSNLVPPQITGVTWNGVITGTGSFPTPTDQTGTGNTISATVNLNAGATVTYTITGTVGTSTPPGTVLTNTATVTLPPGINDPFPGNNTITDTTTVGVQQPSIPPVTTSPTVGVVPGTPVNLTGLSATDLDGTIASYTITTLPPSGQGTLFLSTPGQGGTPITVGQVLTPTQISQLFFQPTPGFTGGTFTYTATDNTGTTATTPGTVTLSVNVPPTLPNNPSIEIPPDEPTKLTGLTGTDPDGQLTSYTITTLPSATQGTLFIGNPNQGGAPVTAGQTLTPTQFNQLFFRPTFDFTVSNFTYTATDNVGATSTPGTVVLTASATDFCAPGVNRKGNNRNNTLIGTPDADTLWGLGRNDTLRGKQCNDRLSGGRGRDQLFGDDGNDNLQGNQDNDRLDGGKGNDRLNGGLGRDRLKGGRQSDTLFGRRGNDLLIGNGGEDNLDGGIGKDHLQGGSQADQLWGRQGNDRVDGGSGDDLLNGGLQHDKLFGRGGSDLIRGGRGNDRLKGGSQADQLNAGLGRDVLMGGGGADVITTGGGRDLIAYRNPTHGEDTVLDFARKQDQIDLRAIFRRSEYSNANPFKAYVRIGQSSSGAVIRIDADPSAAGGFRTLVTLEGVSASNIGANNVLV